MPPEMELPIWVLPVLLVLIVFLVSLVLCLACKLRQQRQLETFLHSDCSTLGEIPIIPLRFGVERPRSMESDKQSFQSCVEELERSPICFRSTSLHHRGLRRPRRNANEVWHYSWITGLLQTIVNGDAPQSISAADTQERGTPLFVIAGACPNAISGMQALMYCKLSSSIDFWWIKPDRSQQNLHPETLKRHSEGPFKNSSDRGRSYFLPLAERFLHGTLDGVFRYGLDSNSRAFIDVQFHDETVRMLIYLVWQEDWSMAIFGPKFMEGKICYQRTTPEAGNSNNLPLFARQYKIVDGNVYIDAYEEQVSALLPSEPFQEMHDMAAM